MNASEFSERLKIIQTELRQDWENYEANENYRRQLELEEQKVEKISEFNTNQVYDAENHKKNRILVVVFFVIIVIIAFIIKLWRIAQKENNRGDEEETQNLRRGELEALEARRIASGEQLLEENSRRLHQENRLENENQTTVVDEINGNLRQHEQQNQRYTVQPSAPVLVQHPPATNSSTNNQNPLNIPRSLAEDLPPPYEECLKSS